MEKEKDLVHGAYYIEEEPRLMDISEELKTVKNRLSFVNEFFMNQKVDLSEEAEEGIGYILWGIDDTLEHSIRAIKKLEAKQ